MGYSEADLCSGLSQGSPAARNWGNLDLEFLILRPPACPILGNSALKIEKIVILQRVVLNVKS